MAPVISFVDRHDVGMVLEEGFSAGWAAAFTKDEHYTLFRWQDWPAWVIFTSVFSVLIFFDNFVLNRNPNSLTIKTAVAYTLFWVFVACCFCGWVAWWYTPSSAFMWMNGYLLEWMLSFDNLFVFHLIFAAYATPRNLKHRPLFYGIAGAVFFRLIFIFVGEYLMHAFAFMHLIFGAFLIYTGIKTVTGDDEDEDPSQQPVVLWLQRNVPFVNVYGSQGEFFVRCPVKENGEPDIPEDAIVTPEATENDPLVEDGEEEQQKVDVVDFTRLSSTSQRSETRATMLFLVCFALNFCDLLFAVDSVSAIVAAVNDLFLAYTSAVFAMLGMRAIFFLIDILVHMFSLLKYGVAFILVFVGVKLIVGRFYHIPASIVCVVLMGALGGSMVASVIQDKLEKSYEDVKKSPLAKSLGPLARSPFASPAPVNKAVHM